MSRTVTISALAAMALSLGCSTAQVSDELHGQSPTIVAQKLYDQYDQSWVNHDLNKMLSFIDPSYSATDESGKHMGFAEYRKQQTGLFHDATLRFVGRKTTIKDVQQPQPGRIVVYYESEVHIQHQRPQVGWEPYIMTGSVEATWQKSGDQWKLVTNHILRTSTTLDPQYAASRQQDLQNRLRAVQHAGDSVRACTYSYNGC